MRYARGLLMGAILLGVLSGGAVADAKEIVIGYTGPLSGPAAEYGQDCLNGVDMAVNELNAKGGITVQKEKYTFKLMKLDDRADPTQAVNNARRFRSNGAIAIFNAVFNTIAPMMKINEEKDNEFLIMAYTSTPKATQMGNKLLIDTTVNLTTYAKVFSNTLWDQGVRKIGMLVTLGAYGDEWRSEFRKYWEMKGGKITADKPANYYRETDFSSQLTAILATKPDTLLIGGPSATTALVIEQARNMGYKGGFVLIDQAKPDYIANILKGTKLMENVLGVAAVSSFPARAGVEYDRRYTKAYKKMNTWENALNYNGMHALARAIVAAGKTDDVYAIRAAFPKAFPMLNDLFPGESPGISDAGRMYVSGSVQSVKNGKFTPVVQYYWWPKSLKEFERYKKMSKSGTQIQWMRVDE